MAFSPQEFEAAASVRELKDGQFVRARYERDEKWLIQIVVLCADADADADANARLDRIQAAESMTSPLIRTGRGVKKDHHRLSHTNL